MKKDNNMTIRVTVLDKQRIAAIRSNIFEMTGELYSASEIIRGLIKLKADELAGTLDKTLTDVLTEKEAIDVEAEEADV